MVSLLFLCNLNTANSSIVSAEPTMRDLARDTMTALITRNVDFFEMDFQPTGDEGIWNFGKQRVKY